MLLRRCLWLIAIIRTNHVLLFEGNFLLRGAENK